MDDKETGDIKADLKRFFEILKIREVSDNDREFSPVHISSCRVLLAQELGEILGRVEAWVNSEGANG